MARDARGVSPRGGRDAGWVIWLLAGLLAWWPARAQQAVADDAGQEFLACLQRAEAELAYPASDRELGREGLVRVKLGFDAPDREPEVEVLYRAASEPMVESVRRYAKAYRLPCLAGVPRVEAVQEFVFRARGGAPVHWTDLRHLPPAPRADWHACLRTPAEPPRLQEELRSGSMIKRRDHGNVVLQLRFDSATEAPKAKVIYARADSHVINFVLDHVAQYRMPCLPPGAEPQVVEQQFAFQSYAARPAALKFKDVDLVTLLSSMKDVDRRPVHFDLDTMGCPFQLMWRLGRPAIPNRVGEVGEPNPNRAEFVAWMTQLTMDLSPRLFDQMMGMSVLVTVPCGKVQLG